MSRPAVIMITSNGVGAGHLIRASAIARRLNPHARPIILSMAYSVIEVANALGIECEYIPGRDKGLMNRRKWDRYLRDRLIALIDETGAKVVTFDGVVPYPGIMSAKFKRLEVNFIWIRRGMWQRKPQGLALTVQSKLMDYVIEPGDVAREYDFGPTRDRDESILTKPVSLYNKEFTMSKEKARKFLGIQSDKPAALVQIGVGEKDQDERLRAVLSGLSKWQDLQIVMTKDPMDSDGKSLLPPGVQVKVVRHFPLADVIHAFDATVCAAGYNSVHEVIPAAIPTLLISNNRGTDNQEARARWCADNGMTLFASNDSLENIERAAEQLIDEKVRRKLIENCKRSGPFNGDQKIAEIVTHLLDTDLSSLFAKRLRHQRLIALSTFEMDLARSTRKLLNWALRIAAIAFRTLFPHKKDGSEPTPVFISNSKNVTTSSKWIRGKARFEHVLFGSSDTYVEKRKVIAAHAYEIKSETIETLIENPQGEINWSQLITGNTHLSKK